jgi:hypothetical protein
MENSYRGLYRRMCALLGGFSWDAIVNLKYIAALVHNDIVKYQYACCATDFHHFQERYLARENIC